MDDDKINPAQNQIESEAPVPLSEEPPMMQAPPSIPEPQSQQPIPADQLVAEEAPADITPAQISGDSEFVPPVESSGDNRTKYILIAGAVLFFLIVFITLLFVLLGGAKKKTQNITLTYWGLWDDPQTMKPLIDEYQKLHPEVKIDYTKLDPVSYRDKLITRSKSNLGPDIFRYHNTWLPEMSDVVTAVPDSVMSNKEFEDTFYPVHQKDLKIDNHYYGIPLSVDGLVLVYNDGLLKKAGFSNPPVTWSDIFDYINKLTVKNTDGTIITSGIALGTADNIEHSSDIMGLFLAQNGVDLTGLNKKEAADALEAYRKFAEPTQDPATNLKVNYWDSTMPNSVNAFIQEKVAMIFVPSWEILTIKAANPQLQLKATVVPQVPETKTISISSYWVEGVSRYSKNQLAAWQFLKYLSQKDSETKLFAEQGKTRLFGAAYSRRDLGSLLASHEYLGPVIKTATEGELITMPLVSRTYDNGLNDEIVKYITQAINQAQQGVDYSAAMSAASQGVTQVMTKYNIKVQ